jgi:glycosyltransferase involved in cell wall biosynthesis
MSEKSLLLVAYDFPPVTSAGMHRVTSIAKYLHAAGWDVTVLTVAGSSVHQSEAALAYIPDGVRTVRTANLEWARLKQSLRERLGRGRSKPEGHVERLFRAGGRGEDRPKRGIVDRLERTLVFPDKKAGWSLPLFFAAFGLIVRHRYRVVMSSSPPHSTHLPMLLLERILRFRWVVDFRDPWTAPDRGQKGLRFRIERWLERRVLSAADAVVANTPGNREALRRAFPDVAAGKIEVVTNGLDTDRLREVPPRDANGDLVFTGSIYPGMLDVYAAAVRHMLEAGEPAPRLVVYGRIPGHVRLDPSMRPCFDFRGRVSYEESLAIIAGARALLLLLPRKSGVETWVPSKLYAYLFARAPILALVPPGDAATFVARTGRGEVVSETDPREVARRIREFTEAARENPDRYRCDAADLEKFSWRSLSRRLEETLEKASTPAGRSSS